MIKYVKQRIRKHLKKKYDEEYLQKLNLRTCSYNRWISEKETNGAPLQEEPEGLILPFSALADVPSLRKRLEERGESDIIILAEDCECIKEEAKSSIARIFKRESEVQLVYGDEDELNSNGTVRMNPWLKPDFSPETLYSYFYLGSLVALRYGIMEKYLSLMTYGDARKNLYRLVLAISNELSEAQAPHLPIIMYSGHNIRYWGQEEEYLELKKEAELSRPRVKEEAVSVIIPSRDNPLLVKRCLQSLKDTASDSQYEVIIVDNGSLRENKEELMKLQEEYGFTYLYKPMDFNFSAMCNLGAGAAKNPILLFLNDDCEARAEGWLEHMVFQVRLKEVGAVGAKLYYPESTLLQHCGIYSLHLGPVHKLQFKDDKVVHYDRRNCGVRNVMAVTGACLMVKKEVFDKVQGFDEKLAVAFNDVDFCWRLRKAGYRNVVDNEIHLWHHESLSRGSDENPEKLERLMEEKRKLYHKHEDLWKRDPYYHHRFTSTILDTGFSFEYEYEYMEQDVEAAVRPDKSIRDYAHIKEDPCVAPMVEYAGGLFGWFLSESLVEYKLNRFGKTEVAYIRGNLVVLGSDNACYEKWILFGHMDSGAVYQCQPIWQYRPDVCRNLPDQENVALSGFTCYVDMEEMEPGDYRIGFLVQDRISKSCLLRWTARRLGTKGINT